MKIAGIIGGIGPESTIEYYRLLIAGCRERTRDGSYPPIIINSINLKKLVDSFEANRLAPVAEYLLTEIQRLAKAGADCALIAANTPHIVFDEVNRQTPIPLVSIVEATCEEVKTRGLKKVGLFGTRFTMQAQFYPEVFGKAGLTLVTPKLEEQAYIHDKYMNELVKGVFLPETRDGLLAIVDEWRRREAVEAVILGGTELPLILRDSEFHGIPLLDTTRIHVKAMVSKLFDESPGRLPAKTA